MGKYISKRLGTGLLSLFVLVTITFFLTRMIPGSPFAGGNVSESVQAAMEEEYGLHEPVMKQYRNYLENLLRGDLGISLKKPGETVAGVIGRAWKATASIGGLAIFVSVVLGILLGICHAVSKNKGIKAGIFFGTVLGSSVPGFAAALILLLVFGVKLKWFPVGGLFSPGNYVLPVVALALYPTAVITRLVSRACEIEMQKDYVIMARAKGLTEKRILLSHILRHVLIPVLNYLGPTAAFLMTGSFVVESIFTIPGLGREFVSSISNRDYTMIMGLTIFMGTVVILTNLLADVLCAALNPEIRKGFREGAGYAGI